MPENTNVLSPEWFMTHPYQGCISNLGWEITYRPNRSLLQATELIGGTTYEYSTAETLGWACRQVENLLATKSFDLRPHEGVGWDEVMNDE